MKLWILKRDLKEIGYDEAAGFVVRAESEEKARRIVAEAEYPKDGPGDEGGKFWLDRGLTSCDELPTEGAPDIILRDFNAG